MSQLMLTELLEIELFICMEMDLALITYNSWCAIKPNLEQHGYVLNDLLISIVFLHTLR